MIIPNRFKAFSDFELACLYEPLQLFMEDGGFPDKVEQEAMEKLWQELQEEVDARGFDIQDIYDRYEM